MTWIRLIVGHALWIFAVGLVLAHASPLLNAAP